MPQETQLQFDFTLDDAPSDMAIEYAVNQVFIERFGHQWPGGTYCVNTKQLLRLAKSELDNSRLYKLVALQGEATSALAEAIEGSENLYWIEAF
jgi:hypothetical protein